MLAIAAGKAVPQMRDFYVQILCFATTNEDRF